MGIPVLQGREFTDGDIDAGAPVAIVSRLTAARLWPGLDPIGRQVSATNVSTTDPAFGRELTGAVVGVVGDVNLFGIRTEPTPFIYFPLGRALITRSELAVRSAGPPSSVLKPLQHAINGLDPDLPVSTMGVSTDYGVSGVQQFISIVLNAFSGAALLLAVIGLYGIMSYVVAARTGEIGIRMALGARASAISGMFLTDAAWVIVGGVVAGVAGSYLLGHAMRSLLFGVDPLDLTTLGFVPALLALVALAASYIPARRGARIDPVQALRIE
jgi:hypothetical protein